MVRDLVCILIVIVCTLMMILIFPFISIFLFPTYELVVKPVKCPRNCTNLSDLTCCPEVAKAIESGDIRLNFSKFVELYKLLNGSQICVKVDNKYYKVKLSFGAVIEKEECTKNVSNVSYDRLPTILKTELKLLNKLNNIKFLPLVENNLTKIVELKQFLDEYGNLVRLDGKCYRIQYIDYLISAIGIVCKPSIYIELTDDDLSEIPALKMAIETVESTNKTYRKEISREEFDKIVRLLQTRPTNYIKYKEKYYSIYINTW